MPSLDGEELPQSMASNDDADVALAPFLSLLERDITEHPERLRPVSEEYVEKLASLTANVSVDLDQRLENDGP